VRGVVAVATGMRTRGRLKTLALVGLAAIVAAGCTGGASNGSAPNQSQGTVGTASHPAISNPFRVTARFDASSLGLDHPIGLAFGPDGNLYVTDQRPAVSVISPDGEVLRRWGEAGRGPGQFRFVGTDPAEPSDGRVYVSDSGNYRIEVFSATGTFIRQFGTHGTGKGQFLAPFDLAVDRAGNVYVSDVQGESVSKFSPTGAFVWRIGDPLASDPDLRGVEHLASVDAHGRVVLANDSNNMILYVDSKGHKVDAFRPISGNGACDVTVDALGYTFVHFCDPREAQVFDRTHKLVGGWAGTDYLLSKSPRFGPNGEIFALGQDGTIFELEVTLP